MHLVIPAHLCLFWVVYHPSRTFFQKSLSENPKIGFPLLPAAKPYPLLPLTHVPPPLYWLGTSGWYLSLVRAPLPYESIACLVFTRLPLPAGLSGPATHFAAHLPLCGLDESLDLHSLHLVSSLGWVLLGYGPFLL